MPELPVRPDLDQLRRQARELLRAAARGEPDALARVHAVSDHVVLWAAQLAMAREYGFRSWPALKAEVERRRSADLSARPSLPDAAEPGLLGRPEERWSFGGAAAVKTAAGVLSPGLLVVGPGHAALDASFVPTAVTAPPPPAGPRRRLMSLSQRAAALVRRPEMKLPEFDDVAITDDRGTTYDLRLEGLAGYNPVRPGPEPVQVLFRLEPVPARETAWIELRPQDGPATRLVPSPRAAVHVGGVTPVSAAEMELAELARWLIELSLAGFSEGLHSHCATALARAAEIQESGELDAASELPDQLARLCALLAGERPADDLPLAWSGMLGSANRSDGPGHHLNVAAVLAPLCGVVVHVDSLVSGRGDWILHLRATPRWFTYSEDRKRKWTPVSAYAEDDLGGGYVSGFGGGTEDAEQAEIALRFLPRLDPLARRLTLTFRGASEQVAVALDLPAAGRAP
ncbi:MAG TPA: hypothetical protein VGR98_27635 [Streptosporangiaceae bacterium]|nr:hypothetical protein [Streptosporangiaceae bacterium]